MGLVFHDIFSTINVAFMQLKFYDGDHQQKYELENGSFPITLVYYCLERPRTHLQILQNFTLYLFLYFLPLAFDFNPFLVCI